MARCKMMLGNKVAALKALRNLLWKDDGGMYLMAIAEEELFKDIYEEIDELIEGLV